MLDSIKGFTTKRPDRKRDPRSYKYYEDEDDCEDDRGKNRRHLGRSRHQDGEDRLERSESRSRSRSPQRNEINIKGDDSRITTAGIQMKLAVPAANPLPAASKSSLVNSSQPSKPSTSKLKVASIFNEDDDDEPEEMPAECRMRMKNVGRETPTSAGPNSFGKTKIGFCNVSHIAEKKNNK
ncbi:unnamed protein product [Allacma fusca]|uniref:PEST proteolytic signal-containing nuclear protein n=1 Tax=Allacma fusca TaxID=39272 RepID=A0A8J2L063_9HEXA|nr:unnamed protein product [Allacma fusca]